MSTVQALHRLIGSMTTCSLCFAIGKLIYVAQNKFVTKMFCLSSTLWCHLLRRWEFRHLVRSAFPPGWKEWAWKSPGFKFLVLAGEWARPSKHTFPNISNLLNMANLLAKISISGTGYYLFLRIMPTLNGRANKRTKPPKEYFKPSKTEYVEKVDLQERILCVCTHRTEITPKQFKIVARAHIKSGTIRVSL